MPTSKSELIALGLTLDQVGAAALDVEPAGGMLPAWEAVLASYGVLPLSEDERFSAAQRVKQTRGAPLPEVEAVFAKVCQAHAELCAEAVARYRALATQRPSKMFAHAMAAARSSTPHDYAPGAYVLRCPACAAPRLRRELHCVYCGADIK